MTNQTTLLQSAEMKFYIMRHLNQIKGINFNTSEIFPQDATCLPKLLSPIHHRCIHRRKKKTPERSTGDERKRRDQPHLLSIRGSPTKKKGIMLILTAARWGVNPISFCVSTFATMVQNPKSYRIPLGFHSAYNYTNTTKL